MNSLRLLECSETRLLSIGAARRVLDSAGTSAHSTTTLTDYYLTSGAILEYRHRSHWVAQTSRLLRCLRSVAAHMAN